MDDRRFDSLVRSLASGANRRQILKGIFGLGAAAVAGSGLSGAQAARRPTPTPKPPSCPGQQHWDGSQCICPDTAPYECGPACCTGQPGDPPSPNHTECCDNACCHGTCYGEELCCPTNPGPNGQPPTHAVCNGPDGPVCVTGACCPGEPCGDGQVCCPGPQGNLCCPSGQICVEGACTPPCTIDVQIYVNVHEGAGGGICPEHFARLATEVGLYPILDEDQCSTEPIATATSATDGPANFPDIPPGRYCVIPSDPEIQACLDCPRLGPNVIIEVTPESCEAQPFEASIGVSRCCLEGEFVPVFVHASEACNSGSGLVGVPVEFADCETGETLYGPILSNSDGFADFESIPPGTYCVRVPESSPYSGCETCDDFIHRKQIEVICDTRVYPAISICYAGEYCVDGVCLTDPPCEGSCSELQECIDNVCYCVPGTIGIGGGVCTECLPGTYTNSYNSMECVPCEVNEYQDQAGQTSCLPCPAGYYTDTTGQAACLECDCEQGNMPEICGCGVTQCGSGFEPNLQGGCTPCMPGSASSIGLVCLPCTPGTFSSELAQATCQSCPAGTFAGQANATTCEPCSLGSYSLGGAPACLPCSCENGCNAETGACAGGAQIGEQCQFDFECASSQCGCDTSMGFLDCTCRFPICGLPTTICNPENGPLGCCEGDCRCNDSNDCFCFTL